MDNDKERLDIDLSFLDGAKPRDAAIKARSSYRVNWRNVIAIGSIITVLVSWIALSSDSSTRSSSPDSYSPPVTSQGQAPTYRPSIGDGASGAVPDDQFRCSSYDSRQLDLLEPANERELTLEEEELKSRSDQLDLLKLQLRRSEVTSDSDQDDIDQYNDMVDRYNRQLASWRADYALHEARITAYNQQVQARNNYLRTHCGGGR